MVGETAGVGTEQPASKTLKTIDTKPSQLIIAIFLNSQKMMNFETRGSILFHNSSFSTHNFPFSLSAHLHRSPENGLQLMGTKARHTLPTALLPY